MIVTAGSRKPSRRRYVLGTAVLLATGLTAGAAQAADFLVTTLDDKFDSVDNCTVDPAEDCSLREAITAANANGTTPDTIAFAVGGTINLTLGQLPGTFDVTIDGDVDGDGTPDITIDAGGASRVFVFIANTSAINGLLITGGEAPFGTGGGGGILNFGVSLSVTNSTIEGNVAEFGGGIRSAGSLSVINSTISGNSAVVVPGNGGGIHKDTGGTDDGGTLAVINSTISGNEALLGGAISIIGISVENEPVPIDVFITNSTITGNAASSGSIANLNGTIDIKASIVAGQLNGDDCLDLDSTIGGITSLDHNIEGGTTCGFTGIGDHQDTNPLLGLLMDNGGGTPTHALLPDSPAIDAIPLLDCTDAFGDEVLADQRGVSRPQPFPDGSCDIGAFELIQETEIVIADVIDLFEQAVEAGSLVGVGPGNSAANRLNALDNMLHAAGDLIAQGELEQACGQLRQILRRIDGEPEPPDFATGDEAADQIFDAILDLSDGLACDA